MSCDHKVGSWFRDVANSGWSRGLSLEGQAKRRLECQAGLISIQAVPSTWKPGLLCSGACTALHRHFDNYRAHQIRYDLIGAIFNCAQLVIHEIEPLPAVHQKDIQWNVWTVLLQVKPRLKRDDCQETEQCNVVIHCSDGWDRTAQVASVTATNEKVREPQVDLVSRVFTNPK